MMLKLSKKIALAFLLLGLGGVLMGCFNNDEDISWDDERHSKEASPRVEKFKMVDVFDITEDSKWDEVTLSLKSKKYWDFQLGPFYDFEASEYSHFRNYDGGVTGWVGYELLDKDTLIIPFTYAEEKGVFSIKNFVYHTDTQTGKVIENTCIWVNNPEIIDGKWIRSNFWYYDFRELYGVRLETHYLPQYCDIENYEKWAQSAFDYYAQKLLVLGTGASASKTEELEKKLIESYYDELLAGAFDQAFSHSLFKWEKKTENPYDEWYGNLGSGSIQEIKAVGDHTYEVKNTMVYCSPEWKYDYQWNKAGTDKYQWGYSCVTDENLNTTTQYRSTKQIVIRDGKVWIDNIASKDVTPKWVCDKVVEDARVPLKNYVILRKDTYEGDHRSDTEPDAPWTLKDDESITQIGSLSKRIKTKLWEDVMEDFFDILHHKCPDAGKGDSCYIGDSSWSTLDKKHTLAIKSSEIFFGDSGLIIIDWVKFSQDSSISLEQTFYNATHDKFYLLQSYPSRWWDHDWWAIPNFTDKEVNQRVGYVVKECHIEGEE